VSNNVGIDFTELGPPLGTTAQNTASKDHGNEKRDDLTTIEFRVKLKEKAVIQDYVNRMYNQLVVDPKTEEQKRMLDYPSIELVTKLVSFWYKTQFNWFLLTGIFIFSNHHLISIGVRNWQVASKTK
jgi:hypothetical protein